MTQFVWLRSSVPTPISELEFDLMGAGYAAGFGRALTAFLDHPVDVLISRHHGHLYSTLASGARHQPLALLEICGTSWTDVVLPRLAEHLRLFRELDDEKTGPALRHARHLFAECTALHHAMLLPARQAITDLLTLSRAITAHAGGECSSERAVLDAVTAVGTPTFRAAERLVDNALPEVLDDARITDVAADGACDGDGYGLAQPGWLDDATYPHRVRRFLRRFGVTRQSLHSLHAAATDRRTKALANLERRCPAALRREFATQLTMARAGAELAEVHGPIMHVRYVHELRRLVLAHGRKLAGIGSLSDPHEIFHVRLTEIDRHAVALRLLDPRGASYLQHLREPLPVPRRRSRASAGRALPSDVASRLGGMGGQTGRRTGARTWQGIGAAPGFGQGPLRALRIQADLDRLEPGDVALVPDAGSAWGWLALAGVPLIVGHGGLLGHAPALARECGTGCVIDGSGVTGLVAEGRMVKVSGETGEVTW